MKKQVIVLAFNPNISNCQSQTVPSVFPGLSLNTNLSYNHPNQLISVQKSVLNTFVPICPGKSKDPHYKREDRKAEESRIKSDEIDSYREPDGLELEDKKGPKRKKNKGKSDFEIKNVLQQISSSIQSCVKDGYIYTLTDQYLNKLEAETNEETVQLYKRNIARMQFLLDNPTEYNFGCLLKMGNEIHSGLDFVFRSRILKKYIQCSKIRTLKQKSICLQAVDYLFRCFKQKQICSLHTWAHKRDEKLQGKIARLRHRCKRQIEK